jgi:hypothetical protein
MPDPTGPELLDALERILDVLPSGATWDCDLAARNVPYGAIRRLRSLLRTPEETAVLRAAFRSYAARKRILKEGLAAFEASTAAEMALFDALDAIPPERHAALVKEDSDG